MYLTDIVEEDDDSFDDEDFYNIDTPAETIQAYALQRRDFGKPSATQRVRMSCDKWMKLNTEQRDAWDKIDDQGKAVILGYDAKPSPTRPPTSQRQTISLHDISAYDYLLAAKAH